MGERKVQGGKYPLKKDLDSKSIKKDKLGIQRNKLLFILWFIIFSGNSKIGHVPFFYRVY